MDSRSTSASTKKADRVEGVSEKGAIIADPSEPARRESKHGLQFWLAISILCLIGFAACLDNTIIFTALPTIVSDIGGENKYAWIANSYVLASVAIQPLLGQLCNIFGRRSIFLIVVSLFAIGAGISGGAINPGMLIAGRTIQGLGCGGIMTLMDLIICDLTSQRERGKYLGFVLAFCGLGTTLGPLIGGALATAAWRWVFYITLPFSGLAFASSFAFLRLRYERSGDLMDTIKRIDIVGNIIFIGSITSICFGLIQAGSQYPWSSWHVIVPIVVGFVGWAAFHVYEATPYCLKPVVPPCLFTNRTAATGFFICFISAMLLEWLVYILPLYFQAVKGTTPFRSGVDTLPFIALFMPFGIIGGAFIAKTGKYIPMHAAGFAALALGAGLLSTMDSSTKTVEWFFWQFFASLGVGLHQATIIPGIQSSLPPSEVASSTATFSFLRAFGMVWGIVIPSTILDSRVNRQLSDLGNPILSAALGNGRAYGAASPGSLRSLSPDLYVQATSIYAQALKTVWYVAMAFSLVGFLAVFVEKHVELRQEVAEDFNIDDGSEKKETDGKGL